MKVVKMPETGRKFIPYDVMGKIISFNNDELMFNVATKERDYDVEIDICRDSTGGLVMGTPTGERYIAQVHIPAREYTESEIPNPEYREDAETGMGSQTIIRRDPVPFSMEKCTLILWEMED